MTERTSTWGILRNIGYPELYMTTFAFSNGRQNDTFSVDGLRKTFLSLKKKYNNIFTANNDHIITSVDYTYGKLVEEQLVRLNYDSSISFSSKQRKELADYLVSSVADLTKRPIQFKHAARELAKAFREEYAAITRKSTQYEHLESRMSSL